MAVIPHAPHMDIDALLASDDPFSALRLAVKDELDSGAHRAELLAVLEDASGRFAAAGREDWSETIADVMDCMTGWCGPTARI